MLGNLRKEGLHHRTAWWPNLAPTGHTHVQIRSCGLSDPADVPFPSSGGRGDFKEASKEGGLLRQNSNNIKGCDQEPGERSLVRKRARGDGGGKAPGAPGGTGAQRRV